MILPSSSPSSQPSQPSQPSTHTASHDNKLTRLDRSLSVILVNPDRTASREAGIDSYAERLHRFHGTSIIFESSRGLSLGPSTFATACTIFHRFYHSSSLTEYDVWSVAMASTLLATKVEEDAKSLKQIIEEYNKIYARRLILSDLSFECSNDDTSDGKVIMDKSSISRRERVLSSPHVAFLSEPLAVWATTNQRKRICSDRLPQQLNKFGAIYKEWHDQITKMELIVLRQLGFTFYWISDSHPQKFILKFCEALELDDKQLIQQVWDYCNDSCRLDLSGRYPPEVIASSAILLAARDFDITLPTKPRPWWEIFLGNEKSKGNDLVDVANAILGACNLHLGMENNFKASKSGSDIDWLVASKGFCRSLVKRNEENGTEKSFNNPDSFLWFYHKEMLDKEIKNEASSN